MIGAPVHEAGPARRLAVGGALLELAVEHKMEQAMGITAEPLHPATPAAHEGEQGPDRPRRARRRHPSPGAAARRPSSPGAALMAGSACLRFGVF
jgi:hypothetical protein